MKDNFLSKNFFFREKNLKKPRSRKPKQNSYNEIDTSNITLYVCVWEGGGDGIEHQKEKSEMTKISTMKARRPWNNISKIPVGNNNLELYSQLNYISKYGKVKTFREFYIKKHHSQMFL